MTLKRRFAVRALQKAGFPAARGNRQWRSVWRQAGRVANTLRFPLRSYMKNCDKSCASKHFVDNM
ncbi:hypothetical protein KCP71_25855 [Salmonella enterica subsp. enterica]|nr:hypothetical protein KCP71_25855 [Salmonella enterica subsp. enterica]